MEDENMFGPKPMIETPRLIQLARIGARELHFAANRQREKTEHWQHMFELCPHPDCKLAREGK